VGWQRELEREDPRFLSTIMGSPFSVWFCWAFVLRLLDDLNAPFPEFVDFAHSFRRLAEEIIERRAHREEMAISVRHIQPPCWARTRAGTSAGWSAFIFMPDQ